ncbi:hypothetical protein Tco_0666700 [Tanacetum coccineum]
MEELLRAPTEGYEEAIVLPEINADHFEIKTNLLQLVQANPFYGRENDNPHAHINTRGAAKTLCTKEPPNTICDLGGISLPSSQPIFPPSKPLTLKNKFLVLHKNFEKLLVKLVRYSRNKPNASRINATSSKTDERIDKLADQLSTLVEDCFAKKVVHPAPVKAVEETCVTCGGAHSWYNCPATDNNQASVCATTELADRSITYPKGLAEDVFVKVRKFHFPTDFVVVDFKADPLYSSTNDKSVNRIDIIDAVCEEYALELLGFPNSSGGNTTPTSEPFTSEFILEEIKAYLKDDSISPEIDYADCNPEEDICLIEKLLNNDPFQLPPIDIKQSEVTEAKSSIEEPPELELKDLLSHSEYAFLEENDKL